MSTIVVGLGNPLMGDDAAGWLVVQQVEQLLGERQPPEEIELRQASLGGISLMEMLAGYDRAILVDTYACKNGATGRLRRLTVNDLPELDANSVHANSAHDISFQDALHLGKKMGIQLPSQIALITIEITPQFDLSDQISPAVQASIKPAARLVLAELFHQTNLSLPTTP